MSVATSITEKPEPAPTQHRLHRSTLLVASLVLLVGVIMNCGVNEYVDLATLDEYRSFGWPWILGRFPDSWEFDSPWFFNVKSKFQLVDSFAWKLCGNLLVALLGSLTLACGWEARVRRLQNCWQFTTRDWLAVVLGISFVYWFFNSLYHDKITEVEILRSLRSLPIAEDPEGQVHEFGTINHVASWQTDVPADWFWYLLRVPYEHRPYTRYNGYLRLRCKENEQLVLPPKVFRLLGNLRSFHDLNIRNESVEIPIETWQELQHCRSLKRISILRLKDTKPVVNPQVHDLMIVPLGSIVSLRQLQIFDAPDLRGHTLSTLKNVEDICFFDAGLDDEGLKAIASLKNLKKLHLVWWNIEDKTTAMGWAQLCEMQNLQSFAVTSQRFDDTAFHALKKIRNLTFLQLENTQITANALMTTNEFPKLKLLSLGWNAGVSEQLVRELCQKKVVEKINLSPLSWWKGMGNEGIYRLEKEFPEIIESERDLP